MRQLSFEFQSGSISRERADRVDPAWEDTFERANRCGAYISNALGEPIRLLITDNRSVVVSSRRRRARLEVRMHHLFLDAEPYVWDAVRAFVHDRSKPAKRTIDDFVEQRRATLVDSALRHRRLEAQGQFHDLQQIMSELSVRYSININNLSITWGRRASERRKKRRRSVQLGCYVTEESLIRVHPALDRAWVPRFYVESVVHHELLHHQLPSVTRAGRKHVHTRTFREQEKRFADHERAKAWEKENLWRLMREAQC